MVQSKKYPRFTSVRRPRARIHPIRHRRVLLEQIFFTLFFSLPSKRGGRESCAVAFGWFGTLRGRWRGRERAHFALPRGRSVLRGSMEPGHRSHSGSTRSPVWSGLGSACQPYILLAASSGGGGIAADPPAARPVQVFLSLRPSELPMPFGLRSGTPRPAWLAVETRSPSGAGYEALCMGDERWAACWLARGLWPGT